jgi:DNA-binding transcriptional ArsR family regulator
MTRFTHPSLDDVPLAGVLHALAEPARLAIVRELACDGENGGAGLACVATAPNLPRATMSHHFGVLRAAGLIESRKQGVHVINRLRCEELERRFPGVLASILAVPPPASGE